MGASSTTVRGGRSVLERSLLARLPDRVLEWGPTGSFAALALQVGANGATNTHSVSVPGCPFCDLTWVSDAEVLIQTAEVACYKYPGRRRRPED